MTTINVNAPNTIQWVPIDWIVPNEENERLFIERESLENLEERYRAFLDDPNTILPDPCLVRYLGKTGRRPLLELLGGERRTCAARDAGMTELPVRIVTVDDEEAYNLIMDLNDVVGLTTAEKSYRAAQMEALGFTSEEIGERVQGAPHRYLAVGRMLQGKLFSDFKKLCDPSITEWFEATLHGQEHFDRCFMAWDAGLWDHEMCHKEFTRKGSALPSDNAAKGFRITADANRLVVRGTIDLSVLALEEAQMILDAVRDNLEDLNEYFRENGHFGPRTVSLINPLTGAI